MKYVLKWNDAIVELTDRKLVKDVLTTQWHFGVTFKLLRVEREERQVRYSVTVTTKPEFDELWGWGSNTWTQERCTREDLNKIWRERRRYLKVRIYEHGPYSWEVLEHDEDEG